MSNKRLIEYVMLEDVCNKYGIDIEDAHCAFSDSMIGDPNADMVLVSLDRVLRIVGCDVKNSETPELLVAI